MSINPTDPIDDLDDNILLDKGDQVVKPQDDYLTF